MNGRLKGKRTKKQQGRAVQQLAILSLSLMLLMFSACTPENKTSSSTDETYAKVNTPFSFRVWDNDGNEQVFGSDKLEKPTKLHFWTSTCPICLEELPELEKFWQKEQDRLDLWVIDISGIEEESIEDAKKILDDGGYTFPAYFDDEIEGTLLFDIKRIPYTVTLNTEGEIIERYSGESDFTALSKWLDTITKE